VLPGKTIIEKENEVMTTLSKIWEWHRAAVQAGSTIFGGVGIGGDRPEFWIF